MSPKAFANKRAHTIQVHFLKIFTYHFKRRFCHLELIYTKIIVFTLKLTLPNNLSSSLHYLMS